MPVEPPPEQRDHPPVDPADQQPVTVVTEDGAIIEGWPIRGDAVLVLEPVRLPLTVRFRGCEIEVMTVIPMADRAVEPNEPTEREEPAEPAAEKGAQWCALQLPPRSLPVAGELIPPGITLDVPDPPDYRHDARRSMWCWFFPRLRGC